MADVFTTWIKQRQQAFEEGERRQRLLADYKGPSGPNLPVRFEPTNKSWLDQQITHGSQRIADLVSTPNTASNQQMSEGFETVGQAAKSYIAPMSDTGMPNVGMAGPSLGVPGNVKMIREALAKLEATGASKSDLASAYFNLKYPKLAKLPNQTEFVKMRQRAREVFGGSDGYAGMYIPDKKELYVNMVDSPSIPNKTVDDVLDIYGHETTHAIQDKRMPNFSKVYQDSIADGEFRLTEEARDKYLERLDWLDSYVKDGGNRKWAIEEMDKAARDLTYAESTAYRKAYWNSPLEVAARQGGATAASGYLKMLDKYDAMQAGVPRPSNGFNLRQSAIDLWNSFKKK